METWRRRVWKHYPSMRVSIQNVTSFPEVEFLGKETSEKKSAYCKQTKLAELALQRFSLRFNAFADEEIGSTARCMEECTAFRDSEMETILHSHGLF